MKTKMAHELHEVTRIIFKIKKFVKIRVIRGPIKRRSREQGNIFIYNTVCNVFCIFSRGKPWLT